jgi:hypothetical protein
MSLSHEGSSDRCRRLARSAEGTEEDPSREVGRQRRTEEHTHARVPDPCSTAFQAPRSLFIKLLTPPFPNPSTIQVIWPPAFRGTHEERRRGAPRPPVVVVGAVVVVVVDDH